MCSRSSQSPKSPNAALQAVKALTACAKQQFSSNVGRKLRMQAYLDEPHFNLSYVLPESFQGREGWRDAWDDHLLRMDADCIERVTSAAKNAYTADKATAKAAESIVFDF